MKAEKLSTEIAALERQSSKAKNAVLKKVLAKKIDKLKTELESITSEETAKDKIKKAKTKVNAMDAKEFNAYIKELAKNPDFSFLKSMTSSEIVRDIKRTAKPVGWRFRGRKNVKTPTKKDIKEKNNVYYEGRRNRSDVSRKIRLKDGGGVDEQGIDLFEDYEDIPQNLQNILDKYMQKFDDDFGNMDYNDMADMHDEVYEIGYTFESGLDNQPYDLRPIGTKGKSEVEEYKNGGGVGENVNSTIFDELKKGDKIKITFKSISQSANEKTLLVKSKNLVGKGKSFESEKITFTNVENPTGVNYFAYKRKDGNVSFAIGDSAIMGVKIIQKFKDGGGVDLNDWDMPVIRTQFEDEEFEYAQGGETGEPHRTKMNNMMKEGGNVEKYPELRKIADRIAEKTAVMINTETQKVSSKMPYKAQWVLEEVIKDLEERV
jgi:hypothetical protein